MPILLVPRETWWAPQQLNLPCLRRRSGVTDQCRHSDIDLTPTVGSSSPNLAEAERFERSCLLRPALSRRVGYHYPTVLLPLGEGFEPHANGLEPFCSPRSTPEQKVRGSNPLGRTNPSVSSPGPE